MLSMYPSQGTALLKQGGNFALSFLIAQKIKMKLTILTNVDVVGRGNLIWYFRQKKIGG